MSESSVKEGFYVSIDFLSGLYTSMLQAGDNAAQPILHSD